MIGEDIYLIAIETVFPCHYYEFLDVLKGNFKQMGSQAKQLKHVRKLLGKFYDLENYGDILCSSEIGKNVKATLEKIIKRGCLV